MCCALVRGRRRGYRVSQVSRMNPTPRRRRTHIGTVLFPYFYSFVTIYLLQYFFMPNFSAFSVWLQGLDWLSNYAICFVYTVFITALCMVFIELLSNSIFVKRYVLGKK